MPGVVHEILVDTLRQRPALLDQLLRVLGRGELPHGLEVVDSAVRLVDPLEVRPDLVLATPGAGPWLITEVQLARDEAKERRWPVVAAALLDQRQHMGDIVVITPHRRVARWAGRGVSRDGPLGTRLTFTPVVVWLSDANVRALLSEEHPELALLAASAMYDRRGPRARRVVRRALELASLLPAPLQGAQLRAIFNVLSEPMLAHLREVTMDPMRLPESEPYRKWREELEARGRDLGRALGMATALLHVLSSRGLEVDAPTRERIEACTDLEQLQVWLRRAAIADDAAEVFAPR